jgi:hypothetical protein
LDPVCLLVLYDSKSIFELFTGKEKWEVWINRFEAVARLQDWNNKGKLQELLPRLQGAAGDFAFDQMSESTLNSYSKLVIELKNRFALLFNSICVLALSFPIPIKNLC